MRNLRLYPDPVLKTVAQPVEGITDYTKELCKEMSEALFKYKGEGISAPQLGEPLRIFVLLFDDEPTIFINPEFESLSPKDYKVNEGCLSIPGITASLRRQEQVTVKYLDIEGEEQVISLLKNRAVAAQHEMDHLNGLTMFNKMGTAQRHMKKTRYMKWYKKFKKQVKANENKKVSNSKPTEKETDDAGTPSGGEVQAAE